MLSFGRAAVPSRATLQLSIKSSSRLRTCKFPAIHRSMRSLLSVLSYAAVRVTRVGAAPTKYVDLFSDECPLLNTFGSRSGNNRSLWCAGRRERLRPRHPLGKPRQ